ncbi:RNA methyltransferase [Candidatus Uhrbacteria bacterium]|jgi:RNA methyltransferase, TrmH family|nr:RNA methyltransferase [Candidatus Uhrbacteria bacterium]
MLTAKQEKLIKSLHRKKGRKESGLCLVEGEKGIEAAGDYIDFAFTRENSEIFKDLVTTQTPQSIAAVARIPDFTLEQVQDSQNVLMLDGVQDPGNVGAIFRLCHAFNTTLILVESVDPTNTKVIRSSSGSMFSVPWIAISRAEAAAVLLKTTDRAIIRLEKREESEGLETVNSDERKMIIAGSEGGGIQLNVKGASIAIGHEDDLESLNVTHAIAIALHSFYK